MATVSLQDEQWTKIRSFLEQERPKVFICHERRCRTFVEGVLWMLRSGAPWRLLPPEYGNWNSVYKRFDRWSERGIWERLFKHLVEDPDMESVMIDGSVIRAHACAAGAVKKKAVKINRRLVIAGADSVPNSMSSSMR